MNKEVKLSVKIRKGSTSVKNEADAEKYNEEIK